MGGCPVRSTSSVSSFAPLTAKSASLPSLPSRSVQVTHWLLLAQARGGPAGARDPRWHFYTDDKHHYTSPWCAGAHRIMVPFGCTEAPYYAHDPRCPGREGFHHGIDIAMPCGTKLYAGRRARVVD